MTDGKGWLGKNQYMKSDKSPPYTGRINIDGKEYFLNAWVNDGKDGGKYFGLSAKPREELKKPQENSYEKAKYDEEIPF